jgi:hypothetical protein
MDSENDSAFKNLINAKVVQNYLSVHCKDKKAISKVILQLNDLELRARVQQAVSFVLGR